MKLDQIQFLPEDINPKFESNMVINIFLAVAVSLILFATKGESIMMDLFPGDMRVKNNQKIYVCFSPMM